MGIGATHGLSPLGRTSKGLQKPVPKPPVLVTRELAKLEQAIGGRDALVAALSHAPKSRDLVYVLGLIGDPGEANTPLAQLCARGGITAGELIDAYKSGELNRAQAVAAKEIGAKLGEVAADTMRRALPEEVVCDHCEGTGTYVPEPTKKVPNPEPTPCKPCGATGRRMLQGDVEHKKLALEMGHLLVKGGGVNVQVNQQTNLLVGNAGGALERLQAATDQILYGEGGEELGQMGGRVVDQAPPPAGVVEAEVLDSPAEPDEAQLEDEWTGDPIP